MKNLVIAAIVATGAFAVGCGNKSASGMNKLTTTATDNGDSVLNNPPSFDPNLYELLKTRGTGGTATFTGSVDGNAFTPNAAFYDTVGDANGTPLLTFIALASDPNFCGALIDQHVQLPLSQHVLLGFGTFNLTKNLMGTDISKAFTITTNQNAAGNVGALGYVPLDEACSITSSVNDLNAFSGSITVTKLDLTGAEASFKATVGDQAAEVSGSFKAVACPGLASFEMDPTFVATCQTK